MPYIYATLLPAELAGLTAIVVFVLWLLILLFIGMFRRPVESETVELPVSEDSFEARIPQYADDVRRWMETDRPYLDRSFKLTDVSAVVPLNRTYLSRVFNEGLGESFNDMVSRLRMEEAKHLLRDAPEVSIADIAERCGFASHSSFHRAFVRRVGMKPGDYRQSG